MPVTRLFIFISSILKRFFAKKTKMMYLTYTVNTLVGAGRGYVGVVVREELVVFVDPPLKLTLPVLVPRLPFIYRGHCRNDVC